MTRRSRSIRRSSLDQRSAVVKEEVTEQVRAHQKLESLTAQLTSELSAMTRMQQVSARLGRAGDFSTLLHDIIDAAIEITRADMGAIQLLEDGALKIVAQRGFGAPFLDFFNMTREGQAACGAAIQKGERVIVEDVANSHIFAGAPALDVMLAAGARAVQSTPLVSRSGHVLGMLSTHYRAPSRASEHELRQLDVLARQAADFIERNQAEQALQENERRFREMLDALPAAIYTTDAEGRLTYFNPAAVELSGRTPELGTDQWRLSWKLYYPDGAPMPHGECLMAVAIKQGRAVRGAEAVAERPDGKRIWFEPYPTPLRDGEGRVVGGINTLLDVTERKRAEEALRHCSEKYETLLNQAPIGVYLVDADFRIRNVNPTALQVFGDIPDLIGRDFDEVIHLLWTKEYADEIVRLFRHTLETGESYETPERAERRIDRDVTEYYEWRIDRIEMPDDGYGVVCYFRDISSQAQARKALAESEERYRSLFDLVPVCVYACDSDGLIREYNQRAVDLWGRAPEKNSPEEKFCGSFKLFYPDGRFMPHEESPMSRALSGETLEADALEAIVERPDGLRKNVIAQPRALLNERGEIIGAINCLYDISERKLAEAAAAQLAAIVESSNDAIVSKDLNGIITSWNKGAQKLFGYTAEEVIGKSITILIPPDREDEESYILGRIRRGEVVDHYETVRRSKDGSEIDISLTVSPVRDKTGKVIGASKISRDISERKRAEIEREETLLNESEARAEAEAANHSKDEFLALVSHELRSPLNAILGWNRLLLSKRGDDPQIAKVVEIVERSGKAQLQLIEDLLDSTRIVNGKMKLELEPVELAYVVSSVLDALRPAADNKGIVISANFDPEAGQITGDPGRLRQVIWNLASNAIKFTPEGGRVWVELRRGGPGAQIVVRDTGQGIGADLLPYVFDRFKQGDSSTTRRLGGLGLGLALVKHLVELHGGCVMVESPGEGLGATFTVNLPVRAVKGGAAAEGRKDGGSTFERRVRREPPATRLEGLRVLVVDDEAGARELLAATLGLRGVSVTAADSADAALAEIESRLNGSAAEPFDVLIIDIGMPGVDGYELLRRVREHPDGRVSRTRAIALTAYARSEDRLRALQAGFQMHVPKPVDEEELTIVIASLTARVMG